MVHCARTLALVAVFAAFACSAQPQQRESGSSAVRSTLSESEPGQVKSDSPKQTVETAIPTPPGYRRTTAGGTSFGAWLRKLPIRSGHPPVRLYDGRRKANQAAHYAVLDLDVGDRDLQQCADAVIRIRAEYLFAGPCRDYIRFNFTSGDSARWNDWRDGIRPVVSANRVSWRQVAAVDESYANFRAYLDTVFMYAGSASLEKELTSVADPANPKIGDVYIEGGFPGHAVLVVDVAQNEAGNRAFLLAQSYMPAQDIHILRSFEDIDPWYRACSDGVLRTPEWSFYYGDLKRFPLTDCEVAGEQIPD